MWNSEENEIKQEFENSDFANGAMAAFLDMKNKNEFVDFRIKVSVLIAFNSST